MPPKRRVPDAADDDEPAAPAAMPLREETADLIATRLCRFVLLREHMRKPATRSEIKDAVMTKEQKAQDHTFTPWSKSVLLFGKTRLQARPVHSPPSRLQRVLDLQIR